MIPFFDAHCDTLYRMHETGEGLRANKGHYDLDRVAVFSTRAQFFAVWARSFDTVYPIFAQNAEVNADRMVPCTNATDARAAAESNRLAAFLSLEGGETVDCCPDRLEQAWQKGARMVSLTWNHDNVLAGGATGDGRGLSEAGKRFLRRAVNLSMLVDVSHLAEASFWDLADEMKGKPFIASHSNAKAICPHRRNLNDEQFGAIVKAGGFVGINLYAAFLTSKGPAKWEHVWQHIEHFLSMGGEGHVGLGCDLDGCDDLPEGLRGVQDMGRLYNLLLRKNYHESLVRGIFYNNLLRVVELVCGM